jgi:hypothetical protein
MPMKASSPTSLPAHRVQQVANDAHTARTGLRKPDGCKAPTARAPAAGDVSRRHSPRSTPPSARWPRLLMARMLPPRP